LRDRTIDITDLREDDRPALLWTTNFLGYSPMRQSPDIPAFDRRTHASYEVRVRGTMFLWGSASVTKSPEFDKPLVLHLRNNVFGEVVTVGTQGGPTGPVPYGQLNPGEAFSIPIQNITGVVATCALETNVDCLIQTAP